MTAMSQLAEEIHQDKPFSCAAEEAYLALMRTVDVLQNNIASMLKRHELSPTQYNVLRILRGAGAEGLRCSQIGERMITRDSDITRLLDRMERSGLIERRRDPADRRAVLTVISPRAAELLAQLDEPVRELHRRSFLQLGDDKTETLIALLDQLRRSADAL